MRHVLFAAAILIYIVAVGQNWAIYTAAVLIKLWVTSAGMLTARPFTIGGRTAQ